VAPLHFSILATEAPVSIVPVNAIPSVFTLGAVYPWRVRVNDANGNPVPHVAVILSVSTPTGAVGSNFRHTDAPGEVTFDLSFSTTGPRILQAQPFGAVQFLRRELTVIAGEPAQIVKTSGDAQTGTAGRPLLKQLVATVQDSRGNGIPDIPVVVAVISGGGFVRAANPLRTDSSGRVYLPAVAGSPGQQAFQLGVQGLLPVVFTATAAAP
jgi:hypothetical protein